MLTVLEANTIKDQAFRGIMDIVRDKVTYDQKDEIIKLFVDAVYATNESSWSSGYDTGFQRGKEAQA